MARPVRLSVTGVGVSNPYIPSNAISPFNVGFGVVVTGTVTYTVEHTFDDAGVSPTWFPHETVVAQTTSQDGNYAFPCSAIRLNVTAGTGTAVLTLIQAG